MTGDAYLQDLLGRYSGLGKAAAEASAGKIVPFIHEWGGDLVSEIVPSGSFAKGTAIRGGTDIDLFISIRADAPYSLEELYTDLYCSLGKAGYVSRMQNVSIGIFLDKVKVDLVPGKRQSAGSEDHSLYRRRDRTWMKTNIEKQIRYVAQSGRLEEIRLMKIWRNFQGVRFPSFCLELAVIEGLKGRAAGRTEENVWHVLGFLAEQIERREFFDPGNPSNAVSEELDVSERRTIAGKAAMSREHSVWERIVA